MPQGIGQFEHYQFGFGSEYSSHARGSSARSIQAAPWRSPGVGGVGANLTSIRPITGSVMGPMRAALSEYGRQQEETQRRMKNFAVGRGVLGVKEGADAAADWAAPSDVLAQHRETGAPVGIRNVVPSLQWPPKQSPRET